MATALVSTVPGAITTLMGYMNAVAAANPQLDCGVFLGEPAQAEVTNNFMIVGEFDTWLPLSPDTFNWAAIPGQNDLIEEQYDLQGCIRALSTNFDPLGRLTDAFTLLNGLHQQIRSDLKGSGNLSTTGSWGKFTAHLEQFGWMGKAFGVVIGFELEVLNAQISGPATS